MNYILCLGSFHFVSCVNEVSWCHIVVAKGGPVVCDIVLGILIAFMKGYSQ